MYVTMCGVVCAHVVGDSVCDHVWCGVFFMVFLIRFYPDIYDLGGFKELEEEYGSWFSYKGSPRAQIFARNHTDVTDIASMIKLMR